MFGIGLPELILLAVVALLVFDPEKLPELARSLAKVIMSVREATRDVRASLDEEVRRIRAEVETNLSQKKNDGGEKGEK